MKRFYSKIGLEIVIPLVLIFGITGTIMVMQGAWLGVAIHLFSMLLISHLITNTYYQIEDDKLRIKSGFIINKFIAIDAIRKIQKSNNIFSSPAASLDRLEIFYNKYDSVLISPKHKQEFLDELRKVNPAIEIIVPD
ncbi:MAG: PH domain-containing protein [Cyclobacteriaceae bacterium]|nr:PH domain-containing protein [Cyclobacteriaceae bacterium]